MVVYADAPHLTSLSDPHPGTPAHKGAQEEIRMLRGVSSLVLVLGGLQAAALPQRTHRGDKVGLCWLPNLPLPSPDAVGVLSGQLQSLLPPASRPTLPVPTIPSFPTIPSILPLPVLPALPTFSPLQALLPLLPPQALLPLAPSGRRDNRGEEAAPGQGRQLPLQPRG